MTAVATSSYHGLRVKMEKKFVQGFGILSCYTFSKAMSICGNGFGMSASPQNSRDLSAERALSAFHRRHNFVISYVYELPFKNRSVEGARWRTISTRILQGWEINGITTARTGQPINVTIPRDIPNIGSRGYVVRPNLVADPQLPNPSSAAWFNRAAFEEPDPYQFGSAGRNIVLGPGTYNWTFGLFKNIDFQERQRRIQFRIETFNLFNRVNLSNTDTNFDSATFGEVLAAAPARQVQFGLKYLF